MQFFWEGISGAFSLLLSGDPSVLQAGWRSLSISCVSVLIASFVAIPFGVWLAQARFVGRRVVVVLCRAAMSLPTVLIGLLCYGLFTRRGPLADLNLLYTKTAIIVGELLLAFPIVVTWTHGAVRSLDYRVIETAKTLGAGRLRQLITCLSEARFAVVLAVLTAFARCITELGIALMVGGNIEGQTRTLTTATALETSRGEFERGVAMSLILLLIAMTVTALIALLQYRLEGDNRD
ncbi:MAG: ABC transporter permease [Planctomycetales bacterium]|nr:ABC transporter permease [Planctomycetales bacterium]